MLCINLYVNICPSVRPSVQHTLTYCIQMANDIIVGCSDCYRTLTEVIQSIVVSSNDLEQTFFPAISICMWSSSSC